MGVSKEQDEINRTCPLALVGGTETECRNFKNKNYLNTTCVGRDHQDCANPRRPVYINKI